MLYIYWVYSILTECMLTSFLDRVILMPFNNYAFMEYFIEKTLNLISNEKNP